MAFLRRGTAEIISEEELARKLASGRKLRVKLGLDPSAPDIHLGHTVVLRKLRDFQKMGHRVICLVGDFTGRIGDPSGKSQTRRQLTEEEIAANARTYAEQIFRILDPEKTAIEFNSRWLAAFTFPAVLELAAKTTVARMLERDDFAKRFGNGNPIFLHEFFYPLLQGYDSVALKADVELGGTDQKFNLVVARHIQREYGQEPEVAVITPILEGTDGVQKMSKSLGNYIGVTERPAQMYGKVMSIPDELMPRYFELLTDTDEAQTRRILAGHPRDAKLRLAGEIVASLHGRSEAQRAESEFRRVFQEKSLPEEIQPGTLARSELPGGRIWVIALLVRLGLAPTNSEARRLVRQGAVNLDGRLLADVEEAVAVREGMVLRVGKKRFLRLVLED